ncbi:3-oxoacyl-[acyl-carrier-protein] reductase FabG isoform X1 [Aplysia californica]|uniref:3-oxoacyl-[acyl-carrier-protein] reductase FabG isoform X1 n=1 Tax=Aplysia californica TaxID=6500 RepID=A0ABM0K4J7_APLCA|nr:3-oxoacyl-[acyl-carrier-protein] reductase FabG isoform X1 [Aplysia californica]XP_005108593.1 3-oxoacyl-[acyl-carrier-protein] reductase FabG isoform X1 [Aplysia californica]
MASRRSQHTEQLKGKVCVVTGASSGLGESIAIMFAQRGASVTLCGRNEDRLQASLTLCVQASGGQADRFLAVSGDVVDLSARKAIVEKTVEKFGRLDVLVANAGVADPHCGILTASEETFDKIMNTNVKAVFFQIQEAVPHLAASKGNIIVVSSMLSFMACSPNILYPMSKAAVDHMIRCLAVDLGPKEIRVNAVNPSLIPTRMRRDYAPDEETMDKQYNQALVPEIEKQPLGNVGVTKEAVAEAVSFLASDAASFLTGLCMPVDGGRSFAGTFGNKS